MARRSRVDITRTAERDIDSIYDFSASDDPAAAERWVEEVERQISTLSRAPARCPIIPEVGDLGRQYCHLLYGSYRTILRIDGSRVVVVRVIHGARLLSLGILQEP